MNACPAPVNAPRVPYFTRVSEHALTWNAKNTVKYQQTCDHAFHSSQRAPYFTRFSGARMQFYDAFLMKTLCFIAFFARRIFNVKNRGFWTEPDSRGDPPFFGHFFPTEAHARNTPPQVLVAGGWWWVAGGWWLAGWALVAGGWWLEYRFRLQINSCRTAYFTRFSDNLLK